jgi:hypothetical protein
MFGLLIVGGYTARHAQGRSRVPHFADENTPTKFSELPNIFRAKAIETAFGRSFCASAIASS